jgi:hypothetical protein
MQAVQVARALYTTPGCSYSDDMYDNRHLWIVRYQSSTETYSTVQCLLCGEVAYLDG